MVVFYSPFPLFICRSKNCSQNFSFENS